MTTEATDLLFVDNPRYTIYERRLLSGLFSMDVAGSLAEAQRRLKERTYRAAVVNPLVDLGQRSLFQFEHAPAHALFRTLREMRTGIVLAEYAPDPNPYRQPGERFNFDHDVRVKPPFDHNELEEAISGLIRRW